MIVSVPRGGAVGLGELPPNIQAGTCIQWQEGQGYELDPDGYIYQWGVPTGKKQCQSYAQPDILPTVLSVPGEVGAAVAQVIDAGDALRQDEENAQALCRQSQADASAFGEKAGILADLVDQLRALRWTAETHWSAVNWAWGQFDTFDGAAENAYTRGNYADAGEGARVMLAMQAINHAPIAYNNTQAALDCATEQLDFWVRAVMYGDFVSRFQVVEANAGAVAQTFAEVENFLANLKANADRVTLSQSAADAIASAKPFIDQLTALATQIAALFSQAQDQASAAANAVVDLADPRTVEKAFLWMKEAQPPFIGAGDQAADLAREIHARLDQTAADLQRYVTQHPELGAAGTDGAPATATKHTGLWLGIGATGVVALLIKKGLLFA